jgi:hypothetical protein
VLRYDTHYLYLIHYRGSRFSREFLGPQMLKRPSRCPLATRSASGSIAQYAASVRIGSPSYPPAVVSRSMPKSRDVLDSFGYMRSMAAVLGELHHKCSLFPTLVGRNICRTHVTQYRKLAVNPYDSGGP